VQHPRTHERRTLGRSVLWAKASGYRPADARLLVCHQTPQKVFLCERRPSDSSCGDRWRP
jgi:hypothetical protein